MESPFWRPISVLALLLVAVDLLGSPPPFVNGTGDGDQQPYRVFRIFIANQDDSLAIKKLHGMAQENPEIDFWLESAHPGQFADVMISPVGMEAFRHFLASHPSLRVELTVDDVQQLIVRNELGPRLRKNGRRKGRRRHAERANGFWRTRRIRDQPISDSYSHMVRYLRTLEFYYPHLVQLVQLGTTHEGRSIEGVKVGYNADAASNGQTPQRRPKRVFWIDGNMHAREWASGHTALFIVNQLVWAFGKDPFLTNALNRIDFVIVPCTNPDGFEYSRSSLKPQVRLWRKNRSKTECTRTIWGGMHCCQGVDLNRNFDFHWAETGSSLNACSNLYCGKRAFSEPETKAISEFLRADDMSGRLDAFITLHTYAQMWIHPFSHEYQFYPRDIAKVKNLAIKATDRLREVYGTDYQIGTGADLLAPASGGSDDWAKETLRAKFVYLVELRPQQRVSNGFILRQEELLPTAVETFEAVKVVVFGVLMENAFPSPALPPLRESPTNPPLPQPSPSTAAPAVPQSTVSIASFPSSQPPSAAPLEPIPTRQQQQRAFFEIEQVTPTADTSPTTTTILSIPTPPSKPTATAASSTRTTTSTTTSPATTETTAAMSPSAAMATTTITSFGTTGAVATAIPPSLNESLTSSVANGPIAATHALPTTTLEITTGANQKLAKFEIEFSADEQNSKNATEEPKRGRTWHPPVVVVDGTAELDEGGSAERDRPLAVLEKDRGDFFVPPPTTTSAQGGTSTDETPASTTTPPQKHTQRWFTLPMVPTRRLLPSNSTPPAQADGRRGASAREEMLRKHLMRIQSLSSLANGRLRVSVPAPTSTASSATVFFTGGDQEQRTQEVAEIDGSSPGTRPPLLEVGMRVLAVAPLDQFSVHRRDKGGRISEVNGRIPGWRSLLANGETSAAATAVTKAPSTTTQTASKCHDERSSCAFWIRAHPPVCAEQSRYMGRNCALSCGFCTPNSR